MEARNDTRPAQDTCRLLQCSFPSDHHTTHRQMAMVAQLCVIAPCVLQKLPTITDQMSHTYRVHWLTQLALQLCC